MAGEGSAGHSTHRRYGVHRRLTTKARASVIVAGDDPKWNRYRLRLLPLPESRAIGALDELEEVVGAEAPVASVPEFPVEVGVTVEYPRLGL